MSNTHTPGPWKFREIDIDGKVIAISLETQHRPIKNNDPVIFAVREDWSRTFGEYGRTHYHADHRIIEAAPAMFDALQMWQNMMADPNYDMGEMVEEFHKTVKTIMSNILPESRT